MPCKEYCGVESAKPFFEVLDGLHGFSMLNLAVEGIALGTAYAIWTGIGTAGTAIVGILAFEEAANVARIVLIVARIGAIVG